MVNVAVVAGEVAIGAFLIVGLFTRLAGALGAVMMLLFTIAAWNFANGPFNETVVYAAVAVFLAVSNAGIFYGLDGLSRPRVVRSRSREPSPPDILASRPPVRGATPACH